MSEAKHDCTPVKVGDLITLLNGLKIDMNTCPPETPRHTSPLGKSVLFKILLGIKYDKCKSHMLIKGIWQQWIR